MTTTSSLKILLLGSSGLLGSDLQPFLVSRGHDITTNTRDNKAQHQTDLTNQKDTYQLLDNIEPQVIINLIGLTNVDRCETHPNEAYLSNVLTVKNISSWIKQSKTPCHLVHISTDQVYDGNNQHDEENVTLTNYYAFSKYAGELAAANVPSTILRTNFFGRSHCAKRTSLTDWLFRSLTNKDQIQVFDDVLFTPLSMPTLSEIIELVITKRPNGIFNLGSNSGMSKADFAFAFAEELKLPTNTMTRTQTDKVAFLKTYRPKDMRMDCTKLEKSLGIKLPLLRNEITQATKEYYEKT